MATQYTIYLLILNKKSRKIVPHNPEGDAQASIFTFQQCLKFEVTDDIIQVVTEMTGGVSDE